MAANLETLERENRELLLADRELDRRAEGRS